jgi:hypothetical protein
MINNVIMENASILVSYPTHVESMLNAMQQYIVLLANVDQAMKEIHLCVVNV